MTYRVEDLEVLDGLEWLEHALQLGHNVQLVGVPVVLDERPELLQAVELPRVRIADGLFLKYWTKMIVYFANREQVTIR